MRKGSRWRKERGKRENVREVDGEEREGIDSRREMGKRAREGVDSRREMRIEEEGERERGLALRRTCRMPRA